MLNLSSNQIGDAGMQALAGAVSKGALDNLERLILEEKRIAIGDDGMKAFADAVEKGALDNLEVCWRPTALCPCFETLHVHSPDP